MIASDVPGSFSLTSVVLVLIRGIFHQDSSLLSDRIFSVAFFPHFMRGGEEKIAVIKEFVRRVLRFLITNLPCHVVTLKSAVRV